MPKIAAVPREDWDTPVRIGQVWRHRWRGHEARVIGYLPLLDVAVLQHERGPRNCTGHTLHRDYRLVTS